MQVFEEGRKLEHPEETLEQESEPTTELNPHIMTPRLELEKD